MSTVSTSHQENDPSGQAALSEGERVTSDNDSAEQKPSTRANGDEGGIAQIQQRLQTVFGDERLSASEKIREALRLGTERLGTEFGQLARIDPAGGTHTVTEVEGPSPLTSQGDKNELAETFCRTVLSDGGTKTISNSENEGWETDPAYQNFGLACYLGTKVIVGGELYGTICFSGTQPRVPSFDGTDRAMAELIAQMAGQELERAHREGQLVEARHRLERTETLLQRVEEITGAGGWELDIQNWTVHWTGASRRLLGMGTTDTSNISAVLQRLRPVGQKHLRAGLLKAAREEKPFTFEAPLKREVGTAQWVEIHGVPYAKDRLVTTVVGTIRDISDRKRQEQEVQRARRESVQRLARAAKHRDFETGEHIERVGRLSRLVAEELGKPEDWQALIKEAAPVHDVGKIGVPDNILLKEGPLSDQEYETMKRHTLIGADLLSGGESALIQMAERIARSHHERWDGEGYPDGLEGENIPLEARIVCVVDAFDAMTNDRPYREAMPAEKAFSTIEEEAGAQFDPQVVGAILRRKEEAAMTTADDHTGNDAN